MAEQQTFGTSWSSLLATLPRPIIMTGLFRDLLIRQFHQAAAQDPTVRELLWRNNLKDSNILVETAHRWKPQDTGVRPAIVVKRNDYSNVRLGIGDKHLGGFDLQGNEHFTTFWSGSHTLFCLGATGAQAEVLSSAVQVQLTEFGPEILKHALLMRLQVIRIGAIGELEEAAEHFVVPVTVGYVYGESWQVSQQAPRLSKVSFSTILEF